MSSVQPWPYCGMPPSFCFSAASAPSMASVLAAAFDRSAFASSANTIVPATVVSWIDRPTAISRRTAMAAPAGNLLVRSASSPFIADSFSALIQASAGI